MHIPIEQWGKDHWSTLAYIETCTVDNQVTAGVGVLDKRKMRCNPKTHPYWAHLPDWNPSNGTRLKGFISEEETPDLLLPSHDDWDCVEDMEAEDLMMICSVVNYWISLTDQGRDIASQLREHKSKGGNFSNFEPILTSEEPHVPSSRF